MEQFGLWNFLKTVLFANEGQQPADPPTAETQPAPTETQKEEPPQKRNACEDFLLRHETLSRRRK
ncbi:MAG: hypothetical protein IJX98_06940 [Clostridia bacterium]|nr:hypothetical protein [Clostridia bacterium]